MTNAKRLQSRTAASILRFTDVGNVLFGLPDGRDVRVIFGMNDKRNVLYSSGCQMGGM